MGIPKLGAVIKEKWKTVPLATFRGFAIAIDFDILLHKHFSVQRDNFMTGINPFTDEIDMEQIMKDAEKSILRNLSNVFVSNKITPIIVIGGKVPIEKVENAREKRQKDRERSLKNYLEHKKSHKRKDDNYDNISEEVFEKHRSLRSVATNMPSELFNRVLERIENKGYSVLKAKYEAEELCAALCLEDKVQAVLSTDTDNLVRRCPILIRKIYLNEDSEYVAELITFNTVLQTLELTYKQFVELCIAMGCDYNNGLRGIGPKTGLQKLKEYGTLSEFSKNENKDLSVINLGRCKEIFNYNHQRDAKDCCTNPDIMDMIF